MSYYNSGNPAPIAVFTYNRPEHLKKTMSSLKENELAAESILYVFSDGAKNESDNSKVKKVREIISNINGFKSVEIIEREKNFGLANSIIQGVTSIINKHEKIIALEDDLLTSPIFLTFMNQSLDHYKSDEKIWSVSGYCHPIKIPTNYPHSVFLSARASSWGWATWKECWEKVNWDYDLKPFLKNKLEQKEFARGGSDLVPMLKSQIAKEIDSWAIRWNYAHFKNSAYCVYPVKSLVRNIGTDGSGTNYTNKINKYDVTLDDGSFKYTLPFDILADNEIQLQINKLVEPSIIRKMINYFKFI